MKGVAFNFFATGAVFVTLGMIWGIVMAISGDHTFAGSHAHLNLVGWVTMALFGAYYALTPGAAGAGMAKIHFALFVLGVIVFIRGIALAIAEKTEALAAIGSLIVLASMLVFVMTIFRHGLGRAA